MTKKFRIAIDASWLGATGIGRVAAEVLERCPNDWEINEIRRGRRNAAPLTPFDLAAQIQRIDANLFWSPGFMPPARFGKTPVVLTVHDLTHLHYYKLHHRVYYNIFIRPLVKRAASVITVSDFSRQEFISWSGMPQDRVVRIYNGVSKNFDPAGLKLEIGRPYILYVGNRRSYKNVIGLMKAFSMSSLGDRGLVLALSGERDEACQLAEIEFGLEGKVHYFGFIPEEKLPSVYRGAHALAFVSFYEGFGLPILEAMACGIPVLTSSISSMPEIAGGAAYLVDPNSVQSIANGLEAVSLDEELRSHLIANGGQRVSDFSWDQTASQYWDTFSRLLV